VLGPHGAGTITVRGQELSFPREDPYVGELTDFAAAIREGRDPEVSGPEGLRNVELLVQASVGD
jgi:predicted dehydrogenase